MVWAPPIKNPGYAYAFDTVKISILLNILQSQIGIRGIAYDWFSSFLCERTMSVKVNDSYSEVHVLKSVVAQSSVLGPVLFNVYIRSFYKFIEREGFEIKGLQMTTKYMHHLHLFTNISFW